MRDPKAIRKAIMTAKSIASLVDPKFARIPLPDLGVSAPEVYVPEHSPAMHETYGLPMPEHYAGGGNVYGDNSKIRVVGSHEGEHRLVPISPKNTNYRHVMEYVPIKWLLERRGNEYRHSPERMAQLRREIEEEGLREPVLISVGKNSRTAITGEGNHRVLAAHQLGYTHIPVRAMVGDAAGSDVFPEGAHDEDIIPKPNKYFPSEAKPSRVMRSLGYEGQEELPERWWDEGYAAGGEVESLNLATGGFTDGGAPDDQYTQNPNGGLMFPPEEGAARLETMQRRNALVASGKKPDAGLPKNPRVVIPAPENSKLPDFVTGNITFDDWRKRHEKILSDDEIHHSSNWYKNIYGNFLKYYPDPQEAKKMMRAWLVAQQNVSPAGAMNNVLMQQEQMERGDPEHLWRAGGMPNPTAAARAVLSGQPIAGGVGQKISDFVDSAEGKSTRSWMGDHPHGGDPFVVDVHTARDTGMIDQELINHLKRVGYDPEQLDKLEIDLKGTPTEAAYENRAQFGRDLTAYLNNIGWKGRSDWTPAEVQAVGWMGMTKLTRNAEEDSESGLGRNLRRISYELSPGEGSPWAAKYGKAFENLPDEDRYAITQKMADSAMEHAKKLSGINVHSLVHGTGAWENYQNPAAVAQSLSTQRAADIAAATLGHLLQQTEVWHNRIKPIGASPKGFALDFIERGSKNLADPGALRDFWQKVMDADPHGIVRGYQPITLPSGEVGLRALFDKGGAKAQKAIEELFAPHQVDKDGNIVQKNPFRAMLEEHPFDLDIMGHEAEITKHRNDWKEQKNGEGYLSRLVELLGHDPSATLNSARQQLEKEFERHLDEAHKRKGTTWRKAYGGSLSSSPVVTAAMKYLSTGSHNDPNSKTRPARKALMIAKTVKKK